MKKYDLIVVGGGFAGVAAAIAAAREGMNVLLAERFNCLGGAAVNCLVNPFMKYWTSVNGETKKLSRGLFEEIVSKMKEMDPNMVQGETPLYFNDEVLKIVLNRMVAEAGVEVLFNTQLVGTTCEGGAIRAADFHGFGKTFSMEASEWIDATGDANLSAMSGFDFRLGRESDGLCQPMTLCFRLSHVDTDRLFRTPAEGEESEKQQIQKLYAQFKQEGKLRNPRENVLFFRYIIKGIVHFNTTRIVRLDPTDPFDVTKAEIEAREQAWEIYRFLKERFPSFQNAGMLMSAAQIGTRESRMVNGEYRLTVDDIKNCRTFEDTIAVGNYDIDIHNPEGAGTYIYRFPAGEYYSIPYRCLIPKGAKNLLVAGRCISVDHETQASMRVMPIVCTVGQAAGTAAAIAQKCGVGVKDVDVRTLRETLKQNSAVID